jgi:hypothetical protein
MEEAQMNRMKTYVWMAGGLVAMAIVGSFTARPLIAQIKAAFVQNVDEPGRNPYASTVFFANGFEFPAGGVCGNAQCELHFQAVPAGKRLVVTNIIGNVYVDTPGVISPPLLFPLGNSAQGTTLFFPAGLMAGTYQGSNMLAISSEVKAYFEAGATPAISIIAIGNISPLGNRGSTAITISGYLVNLL